MKFLVIINALTNSASLSSNGLPISNVSFASAITGTASPSTNLSSVVTETSIPLYLAMTPVSPSIESITATGLPPVRLLICASKNSIEKMPLTSVC